MRSPSRKHRLPPPRSPACRPWLLSILTCWLGPGPRPCAPPTSISRREPMPASVIAAALLFEPPFDQRDLESMVTRQAASAQDQKGVGFESHGLPVHKLQDRVRAVHGGRSSSPSKRSCPGERSNQLSCSRRACLGQARNRNDLGDLEGSRGHPGGLPEQVDVGEQDPAFEGQGNQRQDVASRRSTYLKEST